MNRLQSQPTNASFDMGFAMNAHTVKRSVNGTADATSAACLAGALSRNCLGLIGCRTELTQQELNLSPVLGLLAGDSTRRC